MIGGIGDSYIGNVNIMHHYIEIDLFYDLG